MESSRLIGMPRSVKYWGSITHSQLPISKSWFWPLYQRLLYNFLRKTPRIDTVTKICLPKPEIFVPSARWQENMAHSGLGPEDRKASMTVLQWPLNTAQTSNMSRGTLLRVQATSLWNIGDRGFWMHLAMGFLESQQAAPDLALARAAPVRPCCRLRSGTFRKSLRDPGTLISSSLLPPAENTYQMWGLDEGPVQLSAEIVIKFIFF